MDSLSSMDVLGLIAGTLTTIAFVPQLVKVWRSKSAKDISYVMFILFIAPPIQSHLTKEGLMHFESLNYSQN